METVARPSLRLPHFAFALTLAVAELFVTTPCGADNDFSPAGDELFPGGGHGGAAAASGVPFVFMGEAALGVTDWLTMGALVGVTPRVNGVGGRPRARFYESHTARLSLVVPIIYYPRTNGIGGAPWILSKPTLLFEGRVGKRLRLMGGLGLVGAATMARLARTAGAEDFSDGAGGVRGYDSKRPVTMGLWWTPSVGAAFAATDTVDLFADASLILDGAGLAGSDWVGGPPVSFTVGISARMF